MHSFLGLSLKNFHRSQFISLIGGMIGECGSETSRLSGELVELQGRWSKTEAMLTAVKDSHSAKVSKLEVAIGELERDLGRRRVPYLRKRRPRRPNPRRCIESSVRSRVTRD